MMEREKKRERERDEVDEDGLIDGKERRRERQIAGGERQNSRKFLIPHETLFLSLFKELEDSKIFWHKHPSYKLQLPNYTRLYQGTKSCQIQMSLIGNW